MDMELKIYDLFIPSGALLFYVGCCDDLTTAEKLSLSFEKFNSIASSCNAKMFTDPDNNTWNYFITKQDAELFVEKLEPYLILAKLTEN